MRNRADAATGAWAMRARVQEGNNEEMPKTMIPGSEDFLGLEMKHEGTE
jgi:hypothetical protein